MARVLRLTIFVPTELGSVTRSQRLSPPVEVNVGTNPWPLRATLNNPMRMICFRFMAGVPVPCVSARSTEGQLVSLQRNLHRPRSQGHAHETNCGLVSRRKRHLVKRETSPVPVRQSRLLRDDLEPRKPRPPRPRHTPPGPMPYSI